MYKPSAELKEDLLGAYCGIAFGNYLAFRGDSIRKRDWIVIVAWHLIPSILLLNGICR